jgi:flavin reductase (DIM6/NTAB) family NADH-FMN oxidoreductase RutF
MSESGMHYYEPAQGHGLKHDPFNAIIGPRPIGWISSKGKDGSVNLAPYSFFNGFNYTPPIIGFCSTTLKDTARNAIESGEFVWNLVTRAIAAQMNETSAALPYGEDEFVRAGLTPIPSRLVAAPRVAESLVHFECKVTDVVRLRDIEGRETAATVVFGQAIAVHIDRGLLIDGVFDTFGAGIVLRAGGPSAYAEIAEASRFDMRRPG